MCVYEAVNTLKKNVWGNFPYHPKAFFSICQSPYKYQIFNNNILNFFMYSKKQIISSFKKECKFIKYPEYHFSIHIF